MHFEYLLCRVKAASRVVGLATISYSMLTLTVHADDNIDFFSAIDVSDIEAETENRFDTRVFIQQKIKYGIETPNPRYQHERTEPGLSQVRTDIFAEFKGDLSENTKWRVSTKAEANALRWEGGEQYYELNNSRLLLKDAFIDHSFDNDHWLRVGNQIFAWGESESLVISDVLAPSDQREFGQAELRDIREQIPALMYSLPIANSKLSGIITYRAGHNRYDDADGAFYPYIALKPTPLTLYEIAPDNQWEYALKFDKHFNGGDISVVLAEVNDNAFTLRVQDDNTVLLTQERGQVAAISANRALGSWLIKSEAAYYKNQSTNVGLNAYTTNQVRGMLGAVYSGINHWRFSAELNAIEERKREALGATSDAIRRKGQPGYTLNIRHDAMNQQLTQSFWFIGLTDDNGEIARWDLNYDWSDHWAFTTNVVIYTAKPTAMLAPYNANDSVNFSAKYQF